MSEPQPPTVLIAEDEPLVRLVMADGLIESGLRVIEAANAAEALAVLEAGLPVHVLVTDVEMPPGINGYELARIVHDRWPAVEILVCSGRQWPAEGDLPPGTAFLAKPCSMASVIAHVRSACERARPAMAALGTGSDRTAPGDVVPFPRKA